MAEPTVAPVTTDAADAAVILPRIQLVLLIVAVAVHACLSVGQLMSDLYRSQHPGWEVAASVVLAVVAVALADEVGRDRPTTTARRVGLALVCLLAGAVGSAATPPEQLFTADDWVFGLVGWYGLALLARYPLALFGTFLAVVLLSSVTIGVLAGGVAPDRLLTIAITAVPVFGLQLTVALIVRLMNRAVAAAARIAEQEETARTRDAIAAAARDDHRDRVAALQHSTIPLLSGLADGTLDPAQEATRQRCAIEAERIRRLLSQRDAGGRFDHDLRACVVQAERRGTSVSLVMHGPPVVLPDAAHRELVDALAEALTLVQISARVTVLGGERSLRVSVTGQRRPGTHPACTAPVMIQTNLYGTGDDFWWEASWHRT